MHAKAMHAAIIAEMSTQSRFGFVGAETLLGVLVMGLLDAELSFVVAFCGVGVVVSRVGFEGELVSALGVVSV